MKQKENFNDAIKNAKAPRKGPSANATYALRDKVLLTVRDPAKWHLSVTTTIKTKMDWMANSWLGLPLRWFASLKGRYTKQ